MSDSMAICLSDVLNDSCYPRTLGSEVEPPVPSYMPDIASYVPDIVSYISDLTVEGFFLLMGMVIGVIPAMYYFVVWFKKYKLMYLLRISICITISLFILDKLLPDGTAIHEDYPYYFPLLRNFFVTFSVLMLFVRYHWKYPLNIVKRLHEVSLTQSKREDIFARQRLAQMNTLVDLEKMPPCFPNGWITLIEARDLKPRMVKGVTALGHRFAVFRGEHSGTAFAISGHCPHLGADLSVGGEVHGNCIECPFHGWFINGRDGRCSRGPRDQMRPEVPAGVRAKTYYVSEANGQIGVWYHAEADQQEPTWEMPRVKEIEDGTWVYRGRTEHEVHCHIQEIPENGADLNHLQQLHSTSVLLGKNWMNTKSWLNVLSHNWDPEWRRDKVHPHIARINLNQTTEIFGIKLPFSRLSIEIKQVGPAIVHLFINSWFGRGVLIQSIIPEGPLRMRIIHQLYTERAVKPFWAELFLRAEAIMFERFIAMTRQRQYTLVERASTLLRSYLPWYNSQFFSENSLNIQDVNDQTVLF